MSKRVGIAAVALICAAGGVHAADYYVASDGTYEGAPDGAAVYTSLDQAISAANADDVIYVEPGEYETNTKNGPSLKAKLVGAGSSRDAVVIKAGNLTDDNFRTLKMEAGSCVTNVTLVGNTAYKVTMGGTVYMAGGEIRDCVIKDGTCKSGGSNNNAGGNIYCNNTASVIANCLITGGRAQNRGGNVCLDQGTLRGCTITDGTAVEGTDKNGGNVWTYQGVIEGCQISGGQADLGGNVYLYNASACMTNCTLTGGSSLRSGGSVYILDGTAVDCELSGGTAATSGGNFCILSGSILSCTANGGATTANEGGNVYMQGGTVSNLTSVCSGSVKGSGGCVWMNGGTLMDSQLTGGTSVGYYGGTLYMDGGLATRVTLTGGVSSREGGNLYMKKGTAVGLTITGGSSVNDGGNVRILAGNLSQSVISDGKVTTGNDKKGANVYIDGSGRLSGCRLAGGTTENDKDNGSLCIYSDDAVVENCLVEASACGGVLFARGKLYNVSIIDNQKYGVWSWTKTPVMRNTIVFGNENEWSGEAPNADSDFIANAISSGNGRLSPDTYPSLVLISGGSDFVDYAAKDYRLVAGSDLVNAGAEDPRADAAIVDLAGNPRVARAVVDIGCYEWQPSGFTVELAVASGNSRPAPSEVAFLATPNNVPENTTVTYTYSFGDGTPDVVTNETSVTHAYAACGKYTVKISAVAGALSDALTYPQLVTVLAQAVYVTPGNSAAAFPYDTSETGYATLEEAYAAAQDGMTILVGAGVYSVNGQIDVAKAVTIRGAGAAPTDAILRNVQETAEGWKYRVMQVNNPAARIENLTLENGRVLNQYGGNLRVAAGIVSNCVIRGGTATATNGNNNNAAGGGIAVGGQGGIVTHCQIVGNRVDGTSNDKNYAGAAVFVEYGSKDVRLSNLLVANNRYVSTDATKSGAAGVRYGGANDHTSLENCTIVSNTVEGTLPEDSAGLYCTSWHTYVRNCVIAGNYETGKQKYTSVRLDFSSGSGFSYLNNVTDDVLIEESGNKSKDNQLVSDLSALFKNFDNGDFRPKTGGALVDKGTMTLSLLPSVDLAGNLRQKFAGIDVGCFECQLKLGFSVVIR